MCRLDVVYLCLAKAFPDMRLYLYADKTLNIPGGSCVPISYQTIYTTDSSH